MSLERPGAGAWRDLGLEADDGAGETWRWGGEAGSRVVSKEPQVTVLRHRPEDHGKGGLHRIQPLPHGWHLG